MKPLSRQRFEALIGYTRVPYVLDYIEEVYAYSDDEEKIIVLITFDLTDEDFNLILLARDEKRRFRCCNLEVSIPTYEEAEKLTKHLIEKESKKTPESFFQGDIQTPFIDLFGKLTSVPDELFSKAFTAVSESLGFSSARGIINEVMPHFDDVDNGQFLRKFQTDGFDQRLWELYLYCYFNEELLIRKTDSQIPDFILESRFGKLYVEAVTIGAAENPDSVPSAITDFSLFTAYMRARWLRVLRKKREHRPHGQAYWEHADSSEPIFIIAVADFHTPIRQKPESFEPPSLSSSATALSECLYGVTAVSNKDKHGNEVPNYFRIPNPETNRENEIYGFFNEPESINVSAVISTAVGTIAKFNRMGKLAGFGSDKVRIMVIGSAYNPDPGASQAITFSKSVDPEHYSEHWSTGINVYHNPNALHPLNPAILPHAFHHFYRDNRIVGELLEGVWHPFNLFNYTIIPRNSTSE